MALFLVPTVPFTKITETSKLSQAIPLDCQGRIPGAWVVSELRQRKTAQEIAERSISSDRALLENVTGNWGTMATFKLGPRGGGTPEVLMSVQHGASVETPWSRGVSVPNTCFICSVHIYLYTGTNSILRSNASKVAVG